MILAEDPLAQSEGQPEQLAGLALAIGQKLARLGVDTDADQLRQLWATPPWAVFTSCGVSQAALNDAGNANMAIFRKLQMDLLIKHMGGLPALTVFLQPTAQLALQPREHIQRQLCVLALAQRPGVLRCCINKTVRQALQRVVGSAWTALSALSRHGQPVSEARACASAAHWSCVGFQDWSSSLAPDYPALHRLVALSLPAAELVAISAATSEEAELAAPEALRRLAEQGLVWPA
jgi:Bacterial type III secretion protein (HrpB4)